MRTTIDKAGRIVVPKKLRDRLGLVAGTEIEIDEDGDGLRIEPISEGPRAWIEDRDGFMVIVGDGSWTFDDDDLRATIDDMRK